MAYDSTIDLGQTVDRDYTRITSLGRSKIPFVRSFRVKKISETQFILTINQNQMIGHYPTRAAALGALVGCFQAAGCSEDLALEAIQNQIDNGKSVIEYSQTVDLAFIAGAVAVVTIAGDEIFHDNASETWTQNTDRLQLWYGSLSQGTYLTSPDRYRFKSTAAAEAYTNRFTGKVLATSNGSFASLGEVSLGIPLTGTSQTLNFDSDVDLIDFTGTLGTLKLEFKTKD